MNGKLLGRIGRIVLLINLNVGVGVIFVYFYIWFLGSFMWRVV